MQAGRGGRVSIVLFLAGLWFGVYGACIEPSLPGHGFAGSDARQLLIGIGAFVGSLIAAKLETDEDRQVQLMLDVRTIAANLVTWSLAFWIVFGFFRNFDGSMAPYFRTWFNITNGTPLDAWDDDNTSWLAPVGKWLATIFTFGAPIILNALLIGISKLVTVAAATMVFFSDQRVRLVESGEAAVLARAPGTPAVMAIFVMILIRFAYEIIFGLT